MKIYKVVNNTFGYHLKTSLNLFMYNDPSFYYIYNMINGRYFIEREDCGRAYNERGFRIL